MQFSTRMGNFLLENQPLALIAAGTTTTLKPHLSGEKSVFLPFGQLREHPVGITRHNGFVDGFESKASTVVLTLSKCSRLTRSS